METESEKVNSPDAEEHQENSRVPKHLRKFAFKPGVSGNPGGRPPGPSMKTYAKNYLLRMDEEERIAFLNALDPKIVWEMAEGSAKKDIEIDATLNGPGSIKLSE